LLILIVAALTAAAIQGWRYYQSSQAVEAGELYAQLRDAAGSGELKKVQDIAAVIVDKYPRTSYAVFAALAGAKAAFDSRDLAVAKTHLQWVADNAKEAEPREIARLRLAAVLLEEKQYDAAVKMLESPHGEALGALYADLKGDVLVAQGKNNEARDSYQLAHDKSDAKSTYRALIRIKLDALGDAK
jgi:predicted negative regulator of RcsB-dependent stress response